MTALSLAMIILAYLGGSISSAVLVCRGYGLPDPRENGSHNPGATNVLRLGGRSAAILVFVCDMSKGTVPVYLAWYLGVTPFFLGLIGVAACLGHMYPLFFHFQGGKGVATALGTMLPIGFDMGAMMLTTWVVVLLLSGYSSLAALAAALLAPLYTYWLKPEYTMPVAMLCALVVYRHRENIIRLLNGQEDKIWQRKNKRRP
ncbi:MAG: glycerol-3-phosphate 1-O-acyltransferase PlsY [Aeromonadaceae bacterium]|nr:glycerol-3-phosphate 1-O-acyltransferase PlsY [Aeromonadaceae bacterium]